MHHESPVFRKYKPGRYRVFFHSGYSEEIQADSQRDAMLKTNHLCGSYGPFKKAMLPKPEKKEKVKSYAQEQAKLFQTQ